MPSTPDQIDQMLEQMASVTPSTPDQIDAELNQIAPPEPTKERSTLGTFAHDLGQSFAEGVGRGVADVKKGVGVVALPLSGQQPSTPSKALAAIRGAPPYKEAQREEAKFNLAEPPADSFLNRAARTAGSFVPLMVGGPLTIGVQAAGASVDENYAKLKEQGHSDDYAAAKSLVTAAEGGAVQAGLWEVLPGPLKKVVNKATGMVGEGALRQFVAKVVGQSAEGAVLGATSQAAGNVIEGRPTLQGVPEAATSMAGIQAIVGGLPEGVHAALESSARLRAKPTIEANPKDVQFWNSVAQAANAKRGQPPILPKADETPETFARRIAEGWRAAVEPKPEETYANDQITEQKGGVVEHPGVPQGENVRGDQAQVREETGGQAGGGGGAQPGAPEPAAEEAPRILVKALQETPADFEKRREEFARTGVVPPPIEPMPDVAATSPRPSPPEAERGKIVVPQAAATEALNQSMQGRVIQLTLPEYGDRNNPHLRNIVDNWNRAADVTGKPKLPEGMGWPDLKEAGVIKVNPVIGPKGDVVYEISPQPVAGEILHRFPHEDGMEAVVAKHTDGFSVSVRDTESGETLPTIRIFPNEKDATDYARTLGKKPVATPGPTPAPKEKIVATAIRLPDGRVISSPNKIHVQLYEEAGIKPATMTAAQIGEMSGFLTNTGRFVNQDEAERISGTVPTGEWVVEQNKPAKKPKKSKAQEIAESHATAKPAPVAAPAPPVEAPPAPVDKGETPATIKEPDVTNTQTAGGGSGEGVRDERPATPVGTGPVGQTGGANQEPSGGVQPGAREPNEVEPGSGRGRPVGEPPVTPDVRAGEPEPNRTDTGAGQAGGATGGKIPGHATPSTPAAPPEVGPAPPEAKNIRLTENPAPTGPVARVRANIAAIEIIKKLETAGGFPDDDQRAVLSAWSGWGSFKELFNSGRAERRDYDQSWLRQYGQAYDKLRKLLTPEEFDAAAESSVNAHYTSHQAVTAMWDLARRLGFKGGRALEPATGSGVFVGFMPDDLHGATRWTGAEMDPITGKIFSYLYPEVDIRIQPFEKAKISNGLYDLAITNVPFHEVGPGAEYPDLNLHNYFFARMLDKVKPGGLVIAITTHNTMDARAEQRKFLAGKGQLVGAIRLPNNAFKESAATEVVTDIIVLRKPDGKPFDKAQAWLGTKEAQTKDGPARINEYFVDHPEMVLGENALTGTMYAARRGRGEMEYTVEGKGDLSAKLQAAIAKFPENIFTRETTEPEVTTTQLEDYSLVLQNGQVMESRNFKLEFPRWDVNNAGLVKRAKLYIGLRDVLKEQFRLENDPKATDAQIEANRGDLKKAYNALRKELGAPLNESERKLNYLSNDPDYYTVLGTEVRVQKPDPKKPGNTITAHEPADVLSKRVNVPDVPPEHVDSAVDAAGVSLAYKGTFDLDYVKKLTGLSEEAIEQELISHGAGFKDPESGRLMAARDYLTGDVRDKLQKAIFAAKESVDFERNVKALKDVIPATIPFSKIRLSIDARWLPDKVLSRFAESVMGFTKDAVKFVPGLEQFEVDKGSSHSDVARTQWSMNRMGAYELLEHALNFKRARIMDRTPDDKYVENTEATALANQIIDKMKQSFDEWVRTTKDTVPYRWFDADKGEYREEPLTIWEVLEREFNRTKNSFVVPDTDGSMLKLPGLSLQVRRTPHLLNGVMRAISSGSAVFGHGVGSGKTFLLITAAHELQRVGLMKKGVLVVKKPTVDQYRMSINRAYPGSKMLIPSKADFEPANRRKLAARIASGKWDFIVLTHEQFKAVRTSDEAVKSFFNDQIEQLRQILRDMGEEAAENAKSTRGMDSSVRSLVKKIKSLKKRLDTFTTAIKGHQDTGLTWEKMGIDGVFIDESHNFKKMPIPTQMDNVKGIPVDFSQRAVDLLIKIRDIQKKTNGRNVFFASGTPVSNTLAELWVQFHATNPELLKQFNIQTFDSFATAFADVVSNFELGWDNRFKDVTRMSRFKNGGALTMLTRMGMDVKMGNKELGLDVPEMEGGKPRVAVVKEHPQFSRWLNLLDDISSEWDGLDAKGRFDNSWVPIATMRAGVAAALDPRCVFPDAEDSPDSKVNTCVRDILEEWNRGKELRTTMMVFADMYRTINSSKLMEFLGRSSVTEPVEVEEPTEAEGDDSGDTGKKDDADFERHAVGTFNLYDDIQKKLVAAGVPADEIAIITEHDTDTKRDELFEKVRSGAVRILIGSTEKIGEGVDVPQRMSAQFHLDPPMAMNPAKMEQRLGRIIRQGNMHSPKNMNLPVRITLYAQEKSMDAAIYQMLETKGAMVLQALKGQYLGDTFEDPASELTMAMAEMKAAATGDTRVLELAQLNKKVRELTVEQGAYYRRVSELKAGIEQNERYAGYNRDSARKSNLLADAVQRAVGDKDKAVLIYKGKQIVGEKAIDTWLETMHAQFEKLLVKPGDSATLKFTFGNDVNVHVEGDVPKTRGKKVTETKELVELNRTYRAVYFLGPELNADAPKYWTGYLTSIESLLNVASQIPNRERNEAARNLDTAGHMDKEAALQKEQLEKTSFSRGDELEAARQRQHQLEMALRSETAARRTAAQAKREAKNQSVPTATEDERKAAKLKAMGTLVWRRRDGVGWEPVSGSSITLFNAPDMKFAVFKDPSNGRWTVVEEGTGFAFNSSGETKNKAIEQAERSLQQIGLEQFKEKVARALETTPPKPGEEPAAVPPTPEVRAQQERFLGPEMQASLTGTEGWTEAGGGTDQPQVTPESATGIEGIREVLLRSGMSPNVIRVANAMLNSKVMRELDWSKLRFELERGGGDYAGLANVRAGLIRLSGYAGEKVFPHEVFHFLWELLPEDYKRAVEDARQATVRTISDLKPEMAEKLREGTMTSDEYLRSGLPKEVYHLINPKEFLSEFASERFARETLQSSNASVLQQIAGKVKQWVRGIVNAVRRVLRLRPGMEQVYQELLDGTWKPTPESGREFDLAHQADLPDQRQGSLAQNPRQGAEVAKNLSQLKIEDPEQADLIPRDVQTQNEWLELPTVKGIIDGLGRGARAKLGRLFGDRLDTLEASRTIRQHPAATLDQVMSDPRLRDEDRMLIVGDVVENNMSAERQAAGILAQAAVKIPEKTALIQALTSEQTLLNARRDIVREVANRAISDFQDDMVRARKASKTEGAAEALNEQIKRVQQLRGGSSVLENLMQRMANAIPAAELEGNATPNRIIDAMRRGFGDSWVETVLPGYSKDTLEMAAKIVSHHRDLANDLFALKHASDKDVDAMMARLRKESAKPGRKELVAMVRDATTAAREWATISRTLQRLNPRLKNAIESLASWQEANDALQRLGQDPSWRTYRDKAYQLLGVQSVVHSYQGDTVVRFTDPTTGQPVDINVTMDSLPQAENRAKILDLLHSAEAYTIDKTAANYDPKTAAAWRHILRNAYQFWLNPDVNPDQPHFVPAKFAAEDYINWLTTGRAPARVLRDFAGGTREGREVFTRMSAMISVERKLEQHAKTFGQATYNAEREAAAGHHMTVDQWYDAVFTELAGKRQYLGQVPVRIGDTLISGEVVTKADMDAFRAQKDYTDGLRKIAEDGMGDAAVAINPARIIVEEGKTVRKARPTSGAAGTLPQYLAMRALDWVREWTALKSPAEQVNWLNDPSHWEPVMIAHLDTTRTPNYRQASPFARVYRDVVFEHTRGDGPQNFSELVNRIFKSQDFTDPSKVVSEPEIAGQILKEVSGFMGTAADRVKESEARRAKPLVSVFAAENSFTRPRDEHPAMPWSFYDYGVKDASDRMQLSNDAKAWYALELFGEHGAFDRLIAGLQGKIKEVDKQVAKLFAQATTPREKAAARAAAKELKENLAKSAKAGETLLNYNQLKQALRRARTEKAEIERIMTYKPGPVWSQGANYFQGLKNFLGANLLAAPSTRITHTAGNLFTWSLFYKKTGNMVMPTAKHIAGLAVNVMKDLATAHPMLEKEWRTIASNPKFGSAVNGFAEWVLGRYAERQRLKELGIVGATSVGDEWRGFIQDVRDVFRNDAPEGRLRQAVRLPGRFINRVTDTMLAANPRYNDLVLNSMVLSARRDLVDRLKANAIDALSTRKAADPHWSDNPLDFATLTSQELAGNNKPGTPYEATRLRNLFSEHGLSLDALMHRYFVNYEAARQRGPTEATADVPFLTPDEEATVDYAMALQNGLASLATRNTLSRGGPWRTMLGYLHGLPLSFLGSWGEIFQRLADRGPAGHILGAGSLILSGLLAGVAYGILRQSSTKAVNRAVFNQGYSLPTIENARTAGDVAKIAARAEASWLPVVGDVINGVLLNKPDRMGNLDSAFVVWNFITDVAKAGGQMASSGEVLGPIEQLARRWTPAGRAVLNRVQPGLSNYYNAIADIRAALPDDMEQRTRQQGGGGFQPTPTTAAIREMLEAAFSDNPEAFEKARQKAVELETARGQPNPEQSVMSKFLARNPWLEVLRSLPSEAERGRVMERQTEAQRAEMLKAEGMFNKYAELLGGNPSFTIEQAQSGRGTAIKVPGTGQGGQRSGGKSGGRPGGVRMKVPGLGGRRFGGGGRVARVARVARLKRPEHARVARARGRNRLRIRRPRVTA